MRDKILWLQVAILVLTFVLVSLGLVRTMNANDAQFDRPPTTVTTGGNAR